jgi:hypothetical protein
MRNLTLMTLTLALLANACGDDATPAPGDAGARGATVAGTLTLPAASTGKPYGVRILSKAGDPAVLPTGQATGVTAGSAIQYSIADVPAGSYFVLGFVDNDSSGGDSSTPGDFAGWYGHTGNGNPPGTPNAVVPATGTVFFDFSLVLR